MAAILLSGAVSALAQPTLTAPVPNNLGAGQVTLTLQSSAAGTGYFTLLEGATVAPGSGAQTKAALDANGAAAARFGSLRLAANTAGIYTVRSLKSGTQYTVCFTADDGATLQPMVKTVRFTTAPSANLGGADWAVVGSAGFTPQESLFPSLALAPDGVPYVGHDGATDSAPVAVRRFVGDSWQLVGKTGPSGGTSAGTTIGFAPDGVLYAAYVESGISYDSVKLLRLNGAAWDLVGGEPLAYGATNSLSLAFAPDGTPYVALYGIQLKVRRCRAGVWENVGPAWSSATRVDSLGLTFSPDGVPYLSFKDISNSNRASVRRFNGASWEPVGDAGFTTSWGWYPSLAFAPDGTPHVAFVDGLVNNRLTVMRFGGSGWATVGNAGFSSGAVNNPQLAFAPDGTPYVAFADGDHAGAATVMRFTGTGWATIGRVGFSAGEATPRGLVFAGDGSPRLLFCDWGNGIKATVMKLAPIATISYAKWVRANFPAVEQTQPGVFGPQADPDGGGVANLVRFGFGLPARGPVTTAPTKLGFEDYGTEQYATLSFNRLSDAPGLTYTVQASDDLIRWFPHSVWEPNASAKVSIRDFVTVDSHERRFLRVKVASEKLGLKILVPAYFYPVANSPWARLSAAAAKTPAGTINAIANVNNGPDSGQAADIAPYQQVIRDLRAKGGRVFGYVSTAYGARDLAAVQADIALWYSRYGVDGIFLDEQAATDEAFGYYRALHDDVVYTRGGLVIGNPGTATIERYMEVNEVTCVFETAGPTGFPTWTPPVWTAGYPASKFYVLPYNSSAADMAAYVTRAAANRAGWIYVTDDTLPNPWDTLPSYFETLVTTAMLAE
ncbi:MAG: hypothetical protein IPL39_20770 [Opitutaceae bacterium]|nr:hypothetical protein [Opitutaceae bacterium]